MIGWSVETLNHHTLWEFDAALRGWCKANGIKEKLQPPTDDEFWAAVSRSRI